VERGRALALVAERFESRKVGKRHVVEPADVFVDPRKDAQTHRFADVQRDGIRGHRELTDVQALELLRRGRRYDRSEETHSPNKNCASNGPGDASG
jgi:hypothetical protein